MTSNSIRSEDGNIALFQTIGEEWRVMDFSEEYPETLYWGPNLKHAMRYFGFWTARKSYDESKLAKLVKETCP